MDDLVKRLRDKGAYGFDAPDDYRWQYDPDCREAADEIDELRAATGNLPPALIVKAMRLVADCDYLDLGAAGFTNDEIAALRAATFESAVAGTVKG